MGKPSAEIADLKKWLGEQFAGVENKLTEIKDKIENLDGEIFELREKNELLETENALLKTRVTELEENVVRMDAESRKENLRFYGLEEEKGKTPEDTLRNFIEKELKVDTGNMDFHAVYRVGKTRTNTENDNQGSQGQRRQETDVGRPIFARFALRRDAEKVQRAAYSRPRGSLPKCGVENDLPSAWAKTRKHAYLPLVKPAKARGEKIRWVGQTLFINNKKVDLSKEPTDDNAQHMAGPVSDHQTDPKPQRETTRRLRDRPQTRQ